MPRTARVTNNTPYRALSAVGMPHEKLRKRCIWLYAYIPDMTNFQPKNFFKKNSTSQKKIKNPTHSWRNRSVRNFFTRLFASNYSYKRCSILPKTLFLDVNFTLSLKVAPTWKLMPETDLRAFVLNFFLISNILSRSWTVSNIRIAVPVNSVFLTTGS